MSLSETCGAPTPLGPCNMPKGHDAEWHRHRVYEGISWKITTSADTDIVIEGRGMSSLTTAISRHKKYGSKLLIEIVY